MMKPKSNKRDSTALYHYKLNQTMYNQLRISQRILKHNFSSLPHVCFIPVFLYLRQTSASILII